jgi:hypothetical protein
MKLKLVGLNYLKFLRRKLKIKAIIYTLLFLLIVIIYCNKPNKKSMNIFDLKFMEYNDTKIEFAITKNNRYLLNSNVAQYSSYLILEKNDKKEMSYRIETLTISSTKSLHFVNSKYDKIDNFVCILKYLKNNNQDEIIELPVSKSSHLQQNSTQKLIFNFDLYNFRSYFDDEKSFDLTKIVVAVIINKDFNKTLSIDAFLNATKSYGLLEKNIQLPYDSIIFQQPTIIETQEPRIPAVGLCVHETWAITSPSVVIDWIKLHLSFGIREIRFYDSMKFQKLITTVKQQFGDKNEKLTVMLYEKYNIFENYLDNVLYHFSNKNIPTKLKIILFKHHQNIFSRDFHRVGEHITLNDCFTVFRQKYEFISHYDLDEMLLPRAYNNYEFSNNKTVFTCAETRSICSIKPLQISSISTNYIYDYVKSLIKNERRGRNIDKLSSIDFRRTITFKPKEEVEIKLIDDLKNIIYNSVKDTKMFPTEIFLKPNESKAIGQIFTINENDLDYIKHIISTYENFLSCANDEYLSNITSLSKNFVRYMFYHQNHFNYKSKKIHYYKNVFSVFTHWAVDFDNETWDISPSPYSGHFIHHFRESHEKMSKNSTQSIRNFGIDFEYTFSLLKNFTHFCLN